MFSVESLLSNKPVPSDFRLFKSHKAVECYLFSRDGQSLFVKRYPPARAAKDYLKLILRGTPAACSVKGNRLLRECGFSAPAPYGVFESPDFLKAGRSVSAFEAYSDNPDLIKHFAHLSEPDRKRLIRQFAAEVAAMHEKHIFHGDMNPHNVLVSKKETSIIFIWTDNRKTSIHRFFNCYYIVKNFSQLFAHTAILKNSHRRHFLLNYARARGWPLHKIKAVSAAVINRTNGRHAPRKILKCCQRHTLEQA